MQTANPSDNNHILAVFIDFENLAFGFQNRRERFAIEKILERLVEKGKIVVKKAYCDWSRFAQFTTPLHEAAIELIEIPKRSSSGKNSADIRLVVDAIDLAYSKDHIDTFVIVSGDSDFSPLVSKLKELGKHVIGCGLANATSDLLRDNCDEFLYYEDLEAKPQTTPVLDERIPENKRKVYGLLLDSLLALRRENKEILQASLVKDTMKRKKPSFNEGYHGYATFTDFLMEARKLGLVELAKGKTSGSIYVTRFKGELTATSAAAKLTEMPKLEAEKDLSKELPETGEAKKKRKRRKKKKKNGTTDSHLPLNSPLPQKPTDSEVPLLNLKYDDEDDEVPLGLPSYRPKIAAKAMEPKKNEPLSGKFPRPVEPELNPKPEKKPEPKPTVTKPKDDDDIFGAGLV